MHLKLLSALLLLALLACCAQAAPANTPTSASTSAPTNFVPQAQAFVDQLSKGDFASAASGFDSTMAQAMPETKLKDTWTQLVAQVGAFQQQTGTRTAEQAGYHIVFVTCQFANAAIDAQVVYNDQGQVSGLFFKPAQATPAPTTPAAANSLESLAQTFVNQMVQGNFTGAESLWIDTMKTALPPDKLKTTWEQLIQQLGAFQQQTGTQSVSQSGGMTSVYVTCVFANSTVDLQVTFNAQKQIGGFHVAAAGSGSATPVPYNPPSYVKSDSFHEVEVTVGSGQWALPGTLSIPNGSGPFPAVVLVHGSGANDRDETIGPNKPFRDLAWGLASQGIAVLRYDKRTKVHADLFTPDLVAALTVQDETITDALLAAQLLRQTAGIDPKQVYVLGHSLGAYVGPRIGQQDPTLAGLILLAGNTRPLEDVVLDQYTYLYSLNGGPNMTQSASLEVLKAQIAKVKDPNLSSSTLASDLPLNLPANYWLDLRGYQPAELAKTLSMRLLVLQGGRDYQVSATKDFPAWQAALQGKANATLKLYPDMNHLFISGPQPSTPAEYDVEGHVSQQAVSDIGQWILNH
jgi:dienelactone hydrolase